MQAIKSILLNLYFWPAFFFITLLSLIVLPFIYLFSCFPGRQWQSILRSSIRVYGWVIVKSAGLFATVRVCDRSGGISPPVVFTPNHCSSIEPYLFGLLKYEMAFVTSWPFKLPVYSRLMRQAGYIDAGMGGEAVIAQGLRLLNMGVSVIIWPEGHRSRDGRMSRFRNGAFLLACRAGVPVVPVHIKGAYEALPPGRRLLRARTVELCLLPPVCPGHTGDEAACVYKLKRSVKEAIEMDRERSQGTRGGGMPGMKIYL